MRICASSTCCCVGSTTASSPACMATITMSAPAARAAAALPSSSSGSRPPTSHGCSTGMPLVPYVPVTTAIRAPLAAVKIRGWSISSGLRAAPECSTPAASKVSSVRISPAVPASTEWLEAVVHMSQPVSLIASMTCGGDWNPG